MRQKLEQLRKWKRRACKVSPPPKVVVDLFNKLMDDPNWCRSVRDTVLHKTPYVNRRAVEIVTALYAYEQHGFLGVGIKHLRFLIPRVQHSQMHRLGDFLLTRCSSEVRSYSYYLNPKVTIL